MDVNRLVVPLHGPVVIARIHLAVGIVVAPGSARWEQSASYDKLWTEIEVKMNSLKAKLDSKKFNASQFPADYYDLINLFRLDLTRRRVEAGDLTARIASAGDALASGIRSRVERVRLMMGAFSPESLELRFRRIEQPVLLRFDDAKEALLDALAARVRDARHRLAILGEKLEGGNPRAILKRGYSMVRDEETGKIVRSGADTGPGRRLVIIPERGAIRARVEESTDEEI